MPGRPRIPTNLKILRGNPGRRPLNQDEPQPTPGTPSMPRWLRAFPVAVKEWRREARELKRMRVLTHAEMGNLAMRAYIGAEIQQLAADIQTEGRIIEVKGFTKQWEEIVLSRRTNPKCVQLAKLLAEYRALGNTLGLDPVSRTRIKVDRATPPSQMQGFMGRKHGTAPQ